MTSFSEEPSCSNSPQQQGPKEEGSPQEGLQWVTVKERSVKAATVAKLVEHLLNADGELETRQMRVFFATYRPFASTFDVLRLILSRYSDLSMAAAEQKPHVQPVVSNSLRSLENALLLWLTTYPEDFREPTKFCSLKELCEFCLCHRTRLKEVQAKARQLEERYVGSRFENGDSRRSGYYGDEGIVTDFDPLDFMLSPASHRRSDISFVEADYVAEQLTYRDAELLKCLFVHQCQGHFWSKRHRSEKDRQRVLTVSATVDFFNSVTHRCITSIVYPDCHLIVRAKTIEKWIDVARELYHLRNYSSLKAVLAGLQEESVHRLKSVWSAVSKQHLKELQRLSDLVDVELRQLMDPDSRLLHHNHKSQHSNNGMARIIPRKYSTRSKSDLGMQFHGIIPYLGTFLTELLKIDEVYSDLTNEGLINFDKRQKEYEVMSVLSHYQKEACNYRIYEHPDFDAWFKALPCLTSKDWNVRSLIIEPAQSSMRDRTRSQSAHRRYCSESGRLRLLNNNQWLQKRSDCLPIPSAPSTPAFASCSSAGGGTSALARFFQSASSPRNCSRSFRPMPPGLPTGRLKTSKSSTFVFDPKMIFGGKSLDEQFFDEIENGDPDDEQFDFSESVFRPPNASMGGGDESSMATHSRNSSYNSDLGSVSGIVIAVPRRSNNSSVDLHMSNKPATVATAKRSTSCSNNPVEWADGRVVKVRLDWDFDVNYKCITIESGDRLADVIMKALRKHLLDEEVPTDYQLVQLLSNGEEFVMPNQCSPFYAANPNGAENDQLRMLRFALRRKNAPKNSSNSGDSARKTTLPVLEKARQKQRRKLGLISRWNSGFL